MKGKLSKAELIELVRKIINCEWTTEEEGDRLLHELKDNVIYPEVSDLIFYPKDGKTPTPEEVVEKALAYKPIQLGPVQSNEDN